MESPHPRYPATVLTAFLTELQDNKYWGSISLFCSVMFFTIISPKLAFCVYIQTPVELKGRKARTNQFGLCKKSAKLSWYYDGQEITRSSVSVWIYFGYYFTLRVFLELQTHPQVLRTWNFHYSQQLLVHEEERGAKKWKERQITVLFLKQNS